MKRFIIFFCLFAMMLSKTNAGIIVPSDKTVAVSIYAPGSAVNKGKETKNVKSSKSKFRSWLEKRAIKWMERKLKKAKPEIDERGVKQSQWALILGIASFVFLFLPYVGLLSVPAAILAIIFALQSKKRTGRMNGSAIAGFVMGLVTLLLFLIAIIIVAAILSGGFVA
jgi:hypothetical protein